MLRHKGSQVLLSGILFQIIIVIPNIETLHSTREVLWTLWERDTIRDTIGFQTLGSGFGVQALGFWD